MWVDVVDDGSIGVEYVLGVFYVFWVGYVLDDDFGVLVENDCYVLGFFGCEFGGFVGGFVYGWDYGYEWVVEFFENFVVFGYSVVV